MKKKCRGTPVLVSSAGSARLERITLGGIHNEAWLQNLMHDHPSVLPIHMIEPGFGEPIAIAREVPCASGYIDNLFLTPTGEIIIVEAKLWRNPEVRRKVVAQALDYVAALTAMDYQTFERAILTGCKLEAASLHAMVAHHPDAYEEAEFIDAVSRNLKRGRMLVMAVAEGIREETESLAGLLQSHAGAHFTFALVELGCWRNNATGDILCIPDTLAQTVLIERGIVVIEAGVPKVIATSPDKQQARPHSLSDEMFFEALAKVDPKLPQAVSDFVKRLEPLGVYAEQRATLSLKYDHPDAQRPLNFVSIDRHGKFWTDYLHAQLPAPLVQQYASTLADLIGGQLSPTKEMRVTTNGTSAPPVSRLLPQHGEAWAEAIQRAIAQFSASEEKAA